MNKVNIPKAIYIDVVITQVNCYQVAIELCGQMPDGALVVHGRPKYQGEDIPDPDGRYGHAWVEYAGWCYDFSHNHRNVVDRSLYYLAGYIDHEEVQKYTHDEAVLTALDTGTWGPWT